MKITFDIRENKAAALQNFNRAAQIIDLVCSQLGVSVGCLESPSRRRESVWARWLAIALIRRHTTLSSTQIGVLFDRDHSAILHALQGVQNECATSSPSAQQFNELDSLVCVLN